MMPEEKPDNKKLWLEFGFLLALSVFLAVLLIELMHLDIAESTAINSRTMPVLLSLIVLIYALIRMVRVFVIARKYPLPSLQRTDLFFQAILPLCAAMVLYVQLVEIFDYLFGTILVMGGVLWIFGVRKPVVNIGLAIMSATVSYAVFIGVLGMYMPEGWLWLNSY